MRLQFKTRWANRVRNALVRRGPVRSATEGQIGSVLPVQAEWDEAFLRVESYLRAHHIESRLLLSQLTTDILTAARALSVEYPSEAPVTLAIRIAQARVGEWLVHAMGEGDWADERFRARGRLALLLSGIPRECPELFLSAAELPAPIRTRLTAARLESGPHIRLASMPSTVVEFPLAEAVEGRWTTFNRSAFFRASMSWLVIGTFAGFVWLATR